MKISRVHDMSEKQNLPADGSAQNLASGLPALIASVLVLALLAVVLFFYELKPFVENSVWTYQRDNLTTGVDYAPLQEGDSFYESIKADGYFRGAKIYVSERESKPLDGELTLIVCDEEGNELARTVGVMQEGTGAKNVDFVLDECLSTEPQNYILKFTMQGFSDDTVMTLFYSTSKPIYMQEGAYVNGKPTGQNVIRDVMYGYDRITAIYWVIAGAIVICAAVLLLFLHFSKRSLACKTVACIFLLGIVYSIVFQPFNTADEKRHYGTAYHFASSVFASGVPSLDEAETKNEGWNYQLPVRAVDYQAFTLASSSSDGRDYIRNEAYMRMPGATSMEADTNAWFPCFSDSVAAYLPTVGGICVGWLLHLNGYWTVYMARLFNLLAYCILMYFAMKIIPRGKAVLSVIGLLPMVASLSISCANDILILGLSFLCVAMILRIHEETRYPHVYEAVILAVALAEFVVSRQYHLLLLVCLFAVGCIWSNFSETAKRNAVIVAVILVVLAAAAYITVWLMNMPLQSMPAEDENYGLGFVWTHPAQALQMIAQTIYRSGGSYFLQMIGSRLGWLTIDPGILSEISFCGLLVLAVADNAAEGTDSLAFRRTMIATGSLIMFAVFFTGFVWTSPALFAEEKNVLQGLQGRYFLPGLLPILLGIRLPLSVKDDQKMFLLRGAVFLNSYVLLMSVFRILGT